VLCGLGSNSFGVVCFAEFAALPAGRAAVAAAVAAHPASDDASADVHAIHSDAARFAHLRSQRI
jgi:hypothetical protein